MILSLIFSLSLGLFHFHLVRPHPQCLDFRPPFRAEPSLRFCHQYSDFSCCTAEQDSAIQNRYTRTLLDFPDRGLASFCVGYLYHYFCLPCSPYAAHVFDAELDGQASDVPGLCEPMCESFFVTCRYFLPILTNNTIFSTLARNPNGGREFCEKVKISDPDYCFPDLTKNNNFKREVNESFVSKENCICLEPFAEDLKLRNPLIFRHFPDDSGRIAVGEQIGILHVYSKNSKNTWVRREFMNLKDKVLIANWQGDERGFLGLAFHPQFRFNRKLYMYFSARVNGQHKTQLSEFQVKWNNRDQVDPSSERILLQVDQPYSNHNGGETMFGDDGYFYLFLGDGGAGGDPRNSAQNKSRLLGKAIRIDVDVPWYLNQTYRIPPDNPFINTPGALPEIWAYGIRNIWRCDLDDGDPLTGYGRGRIICGDVGQGRFEEIDIIEKGGNYGWKIKEGFSCYRTDSCSVGEAEVPPIHAYPHSDGKSVTGGHVYRGCQNPALNGAYIYGDYVRGRLWKLEETAPGSNTWRNQDLPICGRDVCFNGLVNRLERSILSFGEDEDGEVYILTTSYALNSNYSGKIYKIVDPRRRGDPMRCRSKRRTTN